MGFAGQLALGLRLARRELRGGIRSLRIVLACLALGVAAIAAVGTLRAGIQAGLQADGARILGGDVELRSGNRPATPEALAWIAARGGQTSAVVTLRSMLVAPSGGFGGAERWAEVAEAFARTAARHRARRQVEEERDTLRQRAEESEALHVLGLAANRTLDPDEVLAMSTAASEFLTEVLASFSMTSGAFAGMAEQLEVAQRELAALRAQATG